VQELLLQYISLLVRAKELSDDAQEQQALL